MVLDLENFQTPMVVGLFMASLIDGKPKNILEPTPGAGKLVSALQQKTTGNIISPHRDFFKMTHDIKYDCVVMNPPFTPMAQAMVFLEACMQLSDNVICLIPWFLITNSTGRTQKLFDFGLVSVTHLPRKTFPNSRIQCCVIKLKKEYKGKTSFDLFNF